MSTPLSVTQPIQGAVVTSPSSSSGHDENNFPPPSFGLPRSPWQASSLASSLLPSPTSSSASPLSSSAGGGEKNPTSKKQRKLSESSTANTSSGTSSSITTATPLQIPRHQSHQQAWQQQQVQQGQQQPQKPVQPSPPQPQHIKRIKHEPVARKSITGAGSGGKDDNINKYFNGSAHSISNSPRPPTYSAWSSPSPSSSGKPASLALPPRVLGTSSNKGNNFSNSGNISGNGSGASLKKTSTAASTLAALPGPGPGPGLGSMREPVMAVDSASSIVPSSTTDEPQPLAASASSVPNANVSSDDDDDITDDADPNTGANATSSINAAGTPPRKVHTNANPAGPGAGTVPTSTALVPASSPLPTAKGAKGIASVSPIRGSSASNTHTNTTGTSLTSSPSVRANPLPKNPRDVPSSPKLRARTASVNSSLRDSSIGSSPATAPLPIVGALSSPSPTQTQTSLPLPPPIAIPSPPLEWPTHNNNRHDPDDQEQALFEQRLCEDTLGVAVRKINQNGKSNLRYVRCIYVNTSELEIDQTNGSIMGTSSTRSVSSRSRGALSRMLSDRNDRPPNSSVSGNPYYNSIDYSEPSLLNVNLNGNTSGERKTWVLTWGKKKDVRIPLERFTCVRKGKVTERTRRNTSPPSRILSLVTDDPRHPSLDIEAPTRLDRDKFAKAFARFLNIPLEGDDAQTVRSADVTMLAREGRISKDSGRLSTSHSVPDFKQTKESKGSRNISTTTAPVPQITTAPSTESHGRHLQVKNAKKTGADGAHPMQSLAGGGNHEMPTQSEKVIPPLNPPDEPASPRRSKTTAKQQKSSSKKIRRREQRDAADDEESEVSSLTGAGFDQEIVEELHHALNELRAELEESRAEAARAVKVAEQAIQSAENSNSKDWNSTVTHKAAEAAALAQKRSAEAMAKQRLAEERLEGERRNAIFWRKQAESAEEEAGALQTRAAAAEVQRAAMAETMESERRKSTQLVSQLRQQLAIRAITPEPAVVSTAEEVNTRVLPISENFVRRKVALLNHTKKMGANSTTSDVQSEILNVYSEYRNVRNQFELLRKSTNESFATLPSNIQVWAESASKAILASHSETERLRVKLARESATRRKLLHEVQDLRGAIRVYCRPRLAIGQSIVSMPSNELLLLHREKLFSGDTGDKIVPLSFEFDGIFPPDMSQKDVYDELEDVCLGVLDGFNVCVMTYGQKGSGKSYTLFGDVMSEAQADGSTSVSIQNHGLHLQAAKQLFSVTTHRKDRYHDRICCTIVDVYDERLCDLVAGTPMGDARGKLVADDVKGPRKSSKLKKDTDPAANTPNASDGSKKLEIKTNYNGETIVQGCLSVEVSTFEEVFQLWTECLSNQAKRLAEQGVDIAEYKSKSHTIATFKVMSMNITTNIGSTGKIQFVDLASSDVVPRRSTSSASKKQSGQDAMFAGVGNSKEYKFSNKSLATMSEVVHARSQFARSVPYRNSTLTHLLSDSLESDTKVVLIACVHSDVEHIQDTACTLRFANKMRKIVVGKATKHTLAAPASTTTATTTTRG